ncbi:MAG: potassium channel family protein [Candidatus Eremiobacteraeota bacterium]|nr:potassium channel family protein [Candidatus Eremiobacteraeota bacterium]
MFGHTLLRIIEIVVGILIVVAVLNDVFQSVIVPRAVGRRFRVSANVSIHSWRFWRWYALRIDDTERRENFLGTYAPLILVVFLIVWVAGLTFGYGIIFYALRADVRPQPDLGSAMYFAGTSLLTIGYGDFAATSGATRFLALAAGASGLGTVAVTTAFLFSVFGAFGRREVFVVSFGARAGAPPSGVTLLETYATLGMRADLSTIFEEGQRWAADVLESHLAFPILAYFRSSHDYESWVGALGALLDASTLVLTTVRERSFGHARLMNDMGRHLTHDLVGYFGLRVHDAVGVERSEFEAARERLRQAGFDVVDADTAWAAFSRLRRFYAAPLDAMARYWRIPPAQWVGDRSLLPLRHGNETVPQELRDEISTPTP